MLKIFFEHKDGSWIPRRRIIIHWPLSYMAREKVLNYFPYVIHCKSMGQKKIPVLGGIPQNP